MHDRWLRAAFIACASRGTRLVAACSCLTALTAVPAGASGTYFVDVQHPNASESGPGTESRPYRSISSAVAAHPGAGTTILVKAGVYRDAVNVTSSGSAAAPYVIRSLDGRVTIDGADDFSSPTRWAPYSADVWVASTVTWNPAQVFLNGERLTASSAALSQLPPMTFQWISGAGLFVNAGGGNPGANQLLVGRRPYGFHMSRRAYVVVDGFTIVRSELYAIDVADSSSNVSVLRDTVTFAGEYGIRVAGGGSHLIGNVLAADNGNHGIALTAGATGCTVRDTESRGNADAETRVANGIYLFGAPANTLYRNRVHDNQDSGIHFQSGSNDCFAHDNLSWNNGDHGYDHLFATGVTHACDVAYGNYRDGFSIEGFSTGARLSSCIAVENGLASGEYDLWVDGNSVSGFESDYNIFWNSTAQPPVRFITTRYTSVGAYSTDSGQDDHTIQADPRFLNPAAGSFHLQPGSPAIDSGDSGAPGWPSHDAEGKAREDQPGVPNTGAGPVVYADRGALEYSVSDRPPSVGAPATASGTEGQLLTISVTASDQDGDAILSLEAVGLPAGASFTPDASNLNAAFVWTPSSNQAGQYLVTFRARNALTASTSTTITIAAEPVDLPPVPALTVDPLQGTEPVTVTADGSGSVDPDGAVASFTFDFGDGTIVGPQTSSIATHTYAAGDWIVTMTVADDGGLKAMTTSETIQVGEIPGLPNLVSNPSFEQGLSGWGSYSGATLSRVSGGHDGSFALQMTGLSSLTSFGINDSPNWVLHTGDAGRRYRFSAWVRSAVSHGTCRLRVREYLGSTRVGGTNSAGTPLSGTWQKMTMDYVTVASGSTIDFQVVDFPVGEGETFLTDEISIRNVSGGSSSGTPTPGTAPLQATVAPSPARDRSLISFVTTRPGPLRVELYDLTGRRVRVLLDEPAAPAGLYELPVEGRGSARSLGSGVFFFFIRAAEGQSSGRIVFLE